MASRAPRPTRKPPLTAWGRFLQDERIKAGRSQQETFDLFRGKYPDAFDWTDSSVTAYGNLERGPGLPNARQQKAFLAEYDYEELPAEEAQSSETTTDPTLRLAEALEAMTRELTAMREEREAWTRGVVAVLQSYGDGQVPADLLDALAVQLPEGARS